MNKFYLCTIVKDFSDNYILEEYCKHYKKYNFEKAFILIHSENNNAKRIEEIKSIFNQYFDTEFSYKVNKKYEIDFEGNFYTYSLNLLSIGEWLCIADIDEFIKIENIDSSFYELDHISGILIDRVKSKEHQFDPNLNIFDNYSNNYFLYNKFKTSLPIKIPFIKKTKYKGTINNGHHSYIRSPLWGLFIDKEGVPIYHFKWRENSISYFKKSLNNIMIKDRGGEKRWEEEIIFMIKMMGDSKFYELIKDSKLLNNYIEILFRDPDWPEKTTIKLI